MYICVFITIVCVSVFEEGGNSHWCQKGRALSLLTWNKKFLFHTSPIFQVKECRHLTSFRNSSRWQVQELRDVESTLLWVTCLSPVSVLFQEIKTAHSYIKSLFSEYCLMSFHMIRNFEFLYFSKQSVVPEITDREVSQDFDLGCSLLFEH